MFSRRTPAFLLLLLCAIGLPAHAQNTATGPSVVTGYVTDTDHAAIPNAHVTADGPASSDHLETTADGLGFFEFIGLKPGAAYRIHLVAEGFKPLDVPSVTVTPGQILNLDVPPLTPALEVSVDAITPEEAALQQVHAEESQRVFGLVPNFYVVYPNNVFVPLSSKLKFQLALKTATDPVIFGATAFYAGIDQAAFTPSYVEGTRGYFQRFGAGYAGAAGNVLVGGAILPSLLHQDPRYFVQGTGTKKSRFLHAASAPFICRGDNGHLQFNASSIGGDLVSSSLLNVYYPPEDRGLGLTLSNTAINTGGRVLNAVLQEFVFGRVTSHHPH